MIFKQLFDSVSSTYTYVISSGIGREALIIDPVFEKTDDYINILTELMLQGGSSTVDSSDDGIIGLMQITGISNPSQDLDNNTVNGDQQNLLNSVIVNATEIVSKIQDADITTEDIKEIVEDAFENTIEELNSYDPEIFNI